MPWRPVGHGLQQPKGYFQSKGSTFKSSAISHCTGWLAASSWGRMRVQGNEVFGSAHKPAAACSACGRWDHYVNSPETVVGSTCWWSLLNWPLCMFPDVSCIRNNWKFTDAFQVLLIHAGHGSGCQNDVLGSWINRDVQMGCENSINQIFFLMKMLFKQYVMLGNGHIIA